MEALKEDLASLIYSTIIDTFLLKEKDKSQYHIFN